MTAPRGWMQPRWRILLDILLVLIFTWGARHAELDDALIYDRYIRNALDGFGLVYNTGEHFNAMTSPLYAYLLLFTAWVLHGKVILASQIIFASALIGACAFSELLFPLAGLLLASFGYIYSVIGMETTLLLFLITLAFYLFHHEKYQWLPLVVMLAALTRFEAAALIPVLGWQMYRQRKFPTWHALIPCGLLLVVYLSVNHYLFGSYMPGSMTAKLGQGRSGFWGRWPRAFLHVEVLISRPTFYVPFFLFFAGLAGIWRSRGTEWNRIFVPFGAILFLFYWLFNMPNYHWYYAPFLLLFMFYTSIAAGKVPAIRVALFTVTGLQACTVAWLLFATPQQPSPYRDMAIWIAENTRPSDVVESVEIGQVGWTSHRTLIDVLGLTNAKNANHIAHHDATSWLHEDQPDYIVAHSRPLVFEQVAIGDPNYQVMPIRFGEVILLRRITPKTN